MDPKKTPTGADVPTRIFTEFISQLGKSEVPGEVTERIERALLIDKKFTEATLRAAILGDENDHQ
jgi:hypothetical protein